MAETLSTLSIISFVLAAVALALAIVLWFFFDISTVVGDLTGRTARKSIAKMRAENEKSGVKKYKESRINAERGKLTETIGGKKNELKDEDDRSETGILVENKAETIKNEETGLLNNETNRLLDTEETGLLMEKPAAIERSVIAERRTGGKTLTIIEEVILIHTDEVIEC